MKSEMFELKGAWDGALRSEEELELIDKEKAEEAFKMQKRKLDDFLCKKDFAKLRHLVFLYKFLTFDFSTLVNNQPLKN